MATNVDSSAGIKAGEPPDLVGLYCSSLYRKCSNCGRTGHNSRTCLESRADQLAGIEHPVPPYKESVATTEPVASVNKDEEEMSDASGQRAKAKDGTRRKGEPQVN